MITLPDDDKIPLNLSTLPDELKKSFPGLAEMSTAGTVRSFAKSDKESYSIHYRPPVCFEAFLESLPKRRSTKRDGTKDSFQKPDMKVFSCFIDLWILQGAQRMGFIKGGNEDEEWNKAIESKVKEVKKYSQFWLSLLGKL